MKMVMINIIPAYWKYCRIFFIPVESKSSLRFFIARWVVIPNFRRINDGTKIRSVYNIMSISVKKNPPKGRNVGAAWFGVPKM